MSRPIAIQLFSVRHQIATDRDGVLRRLAEMGYGAVEPFRATEDPAGYRRVFDELGLTVCAAHAVDLVREPDTGPVFDAVETLGTELAVVPGGLPKEEFATMDGIKRIADLLNGLAEQASRRGLRLGYHNHDHELASIIDGRHALDVLAELLVPEVFFEIDTYWAAVGGADVPDLLDRHRHRVRVLHLKDGQGVRGELNVAVGSGAIAIAEHVAKVPDAWRVVEFSRGGDDLFDAIAQSRIYLDSLDAA